MGGDDYVFTLGDIIPPARELMNPLPGVNTQIISAQQNPSNLDNINAISVLTVSASMLERFGNLAIWCGSDARFSDYVNASDVSVRGK